MARLRPIGNKNALGKKALGLHRRFLAEFFIYSLLNADRSRKILNINYVTPRMISTFLKDSHWQLQPELMLFLLQLSRNGSPKLGVREN